MKSQGSFFDALYCQHKIGKKKKACLDHVVYTSGVETKYENTKVVTWQWWDDNMKRVTSKTATTESNMFVNKDKVEGKIRGVGSKNMVKNSLSTLRLV